MKHAPETSHAPVTTSKGSLREVEYRRSERLLITTPIRVEGVDRDGHKFAEDTHTLVINREGARIYLKRRVAPGAIVAVSSSVGRRTCMFRVVGPTQPQAGEGGEWGIETLEPNSNFWRIGFPPASESEGQCAALIECRRCHGVKLSRLSLVEHEVLGTSGLLVKQCDNCGRSTSWSYKEPAMSLTEIDAGAALPPPDVLPEPPITSNRRTHNRVALQLPIRVRSFYGAEEYTRSENMSRGGMCFISEQNHEVGEILLVTCPYEKGGHNIEVRGQVMRRREMHGTGRKIYGVRYER